ncbi:MULTISPECIES: DNA alkylation repair protein [unclassified Campylobacter]|uniref:DNA alkylation repair protein n=1 Tax=unclassified Campylobacter TaxID=2593542 RepID=UPI0022E9CDCF|nr:MULTISPECIES: DNA alkylation repair protein [unclassified Campylobacter]MDA3043891.1 DNA alkylation repair protein [Campylobacter sp. JMF_09 ED2]MDA3064025.1 DNA alkylation repair protein [Campylobacter sp. JMF_11 EL3]MDA3072375.1 DNA alkylation repair protein [Campylobacter sp. VBCF_03 NA9]MDA3074944.1 DNA alkylation repair protein [Campylobacter sp. JMF_05 ED3]
MEILENLRNLSDEKYAKFSAKILPGARILGVKMPHLRALAKQVLREQSEGEILEFIRAKGEFSEEMTLKAILINSLKISEKNRINLARDFIPRITNWGVCDTFCTKRKKDLELWWKFTLGFRKARGEFEKRFFYVNLLVNFVNSRDLAILLDTARAERSKKYYVQMAASWALCEFAVKFEGEIYEFLQGYENEKIKNLAIKKICESLRFTEQSKAKFKTLKSAKS